MTLTPLTPDTLRDAADAVARLPRGDSQVASLVVGEVLLAQAEQRSAAVSPTLVDARMAGHGATEATAEAGGVRPLEVLRQGPRDDRQRAVVSVLMAHHLATLLDRDGGADAVRALLPAVDWLEFTGPYAPYSAARVALGTAALGRLESLLRSSPIAAASEPAAAAVRTLRIGGAGAGGGAQARGPDAPETRGGASVAGEVEGLERWSWVRAVSVFTGWSLVRGAVLFVGRHVFSFRRPMTVSLDGALLRVVGHTELLGRTLRTFDVRYPVDELVEIHREARYPALPVALSLVSVALGSLLGARAVIEGAGVQYFPLVALGIGYILGGLVLEYLMRALFPGVRGQGRLRLRARGGRAVVLSRMAIEELDRLLDALDARFGAAPQPRAASQPTAPAPRGAGPEATPPAPRVARPARGRPARG